jgi:anti-anti-sigma factor
MAGRVRLGDHLCWRFDDDDQLVDAMARVVADGVAANHQVVYYTHAVPPVALEPALAARGAPMVQAPAGQVRVLPAMPFDPAQVVREVEDLVARAEAEGYQGLRLITDMGWAVTDPAGAERLPWYEARINQAYLSGRVLGVCLYDQRAFDGHLLHRIGSAHPATIPLGEDSTWVPLLRIQRPRPDVLRLTGEIDLTNRAALAGALESAVGDLPAGTPLVVDASGLRFMDAATVGVLSRVAQASPGGLRLTGCRRAVRVVVDYLGLAKLPGVHVT